MKQPRRYELLEHRLVLHGHLGSLSPYMTLSFVPDGTTVSSEQSSLFETFSTVAEPDVWKKAIQDSFNSWAIHTNSDIGVVSDNGDPMGTQGQRQGDDRFGDIRIAAIPLDPSIYAIAFPRNEVAIGTWAADIIFNSEIDWNSIEDIVSVALHEAGHVYGLDHSDDPDAVMHKHGRSDKTELADDDIAAIQKLYGTRKQDSNEGANGNDSLELATDLPQEFIENGLFAGYGDISEIGDVDFFHLGEELRFDEDLSLRIQTDGISLLEPMVSFFDVDEQLILTTEAEGGVVLIDEHPELIRDAAFFSVEAGESGFGIGRYSFALVPDEEFFFEERFIDFAEGELFGYSEFDIPGFLGEPDQFFFEVEAIPVMEPLAEIHPMDLIVHGEQAYFKALGSISNPSDIDVFDVFPAATLLSDDQLEEHLHFDDNPFHAHGDIVHSHGDPGHSHDNEVVDPMTMTVFIQSRDPEQLEINATVFNEFDQIIPHDVIVNGKGQLVIQAQIQDPFQVYFIQVASSDTESEFSVGNYEIAVDFDTLPLELIEFTHGELTSGEPEHFETLYVASPQLFHFLLEVEQRDIAEDAIVTARIFDESNDLVYSVQARPGELRSRSNPLLQPGTYQVIVTVDGLPSGEQLAFSLKGHHFSDYLGVLPNDPGKNPHFQCDGVSQDFCYPGGQTSDQPFFWDRFIRRYLDAKDKSGEDSPASDPDVSWWDWYRNLQNQVRSAREPEAVTDSYRVHEGKLYVSAKEGLLRNDHSSNSPHMIATVTKPPGNGTLNLKSDGSFTYIPDEGFFGADTFTYQAFDFVKASTAAEVRIEVALPGDANGDHTVDFADFLILSANFMLPNATWEEGDFTGDGIVDFGDFILLSYHITGSRKRD